VPRQPRPEKRTYRANAILVKMKKEKDGDIHLVIADARADGKRILGEFSDRDRDRALQNGAYAAELGAIWQILGSVVDFAGRDFGQLAGISAQASER
jgi:hypothetical protein